MQQRIYLDNNASTSIDPLVADLLIQTIPTLLGNPSSIHFYGQKVRGLIAKAKASIASSLKVKQNELVFTSGGTESVVMVLRGFADLKKSGHIITSVAEHSCVEATMKQLENSGFQVSFLPTGLHGAVTSEAVMAAIRPDTKLIALMAVNNETGVKTDFVAIAKIAEHYHIPFFVDGISLLGKENFQIPSGVTAMAFGGHKLHAPQGIGLTFIRSGTKLQSLLSGGSQEFGRRAGTENVLGILGLAKAIELLSEVLPGASERMGMLRDKFEKKIFNELPNASINGLGDRICNVSNLAFEGVDGESLLMALDVAGVAASHGSACGAGTLELSRVLLGMGLSVSKVSGSIRFSLSRFTTEEEIDRAVDIVVRLVKKG